MRVCLLLLICLALASASLFDDDFDLPESKQLEKCFDASTVSPDSWPTLKERLPEIHAMCLVAIEKLYHGKIQACEKLERKFFVAKERRMVVKGSEEDEALSAIESTDESSLSFLREKFGVEDYARELFSIHGGTYWRQGIVNIQDQYRLMLEITQTYKKLVERAYLGPEPHVVHADISRIPETHPPHEGKTGGATY